MEAVLKPDELNHNFLQKIKDLMQHEVNRKVLLERIASIKRGVVKHTLTIEEAEALAK